MRRLIVVTMALLLMGSACWAQQVNSQVSSSSTSAAEPNPSKSGGAAPAVGTGAVAALFSSSKETNNAEESSAPDPGYWVPKPRDIGGAGPLTDVSWTRIGPVGIRSFDLMQAYDNVSLPGTESHNVTLFRTAVGFDHNFRRSRITLQYQPKMVIDNGEVRSDWNNQEVAFDTYYVLSPRWVLSISDHFRYLSTNNIIGDSFLSADSISGSTVQNSFAAGPTTFLQNSANVTLTRQFSATTRISLTPSYTYSDTQGSTTTTPISHTYGYAMNFEKDFSPRVNFGTYWAIRTIKTGSGASGTYYNDFGINYRHSLTPTFIVSGSMGASTAGYTSGRYWTVIGYASAAKSFGRSSIAATYSRNQSFSDYLYSGGYGNRVDVKYVRTLAMRWRVGGGYGYQLSSSTMGNSLNSSYFTGEVHYAMTPRLEWVLNGAHLNQTGHGSEFPDARRDFVALGLHFVLGQTRNTF